MICIIDMVEFLVQVHLLKKDVENPNGVGILVANCREWMKEIHLVRIQHCYRERTSVLMHWHAREPL